MVKCKLNLIAAACENMGIGINGTLPWTLKNEMAFFKSMTKTVKDPRKLNAVVMGRATWDSIPFKNRPLIGRLNIVITRHVEDVKLKVPEGVIVVGGLQEAVDYINHREDIETTWVIGGTSVYKAAMEHEDCDKIYLTEIQKTFDCDTFLPDINKNKFTLINEDGVPTEMQTEGDTNYFYRIYKKIEV